MAEMLFPLRKRYSFPYNTGCLVGFASQNYANVVVKADSVV